MLRETEVHSGGIGEAGQGLFFRVFRSSVATLVLAAVTSMGCSNEPKSNYTTDEELNKRNERPVIMPNAFDNDDFTRFVIQLGGKVVAIGPNGEITAVPKSENLIITFNETKGSTVPGNAFCSYSGGRAVQLGKYLWACVVIDWLG